MTFRKRPSNADRWTRCPGYASVARDYLSRYEEAKSASTHEGLLAHDVGEHLITEMRKSGDPSPKAPETFNGQVIPIAMVSKVKGYAHFCFSLMRRANIYGGHWLWVEHTFNCYFINDEVRTRIDFGMYDPKLKLLHLVDLKYGHREVEVEMNPQMLIEARAVCDYIHTRGEEVEKVVLTIYQPNGPNANIPVSQWPVSREEVDRLSDNISEQYHSKSGDLCPGRHCYYCEGRGGCDALRTYQYDKWETVKTYTGTQKAIAPEYLATLLRESEEMEEMFRAYKKGLEQFAVARLKKCEKVPGYEYTTGLKNREWIYPDADIIATARALGVDLQKSRAVSPAQAEERGMSPDFIATLVKREATGLKLRKKSLKTLKQAFGEKS